MPEHEQFGILDRFRGALDTAGTLALNCLRHFSGVKAAQVGQTEREAIWSRDKVTVYRYSSSDRTSAVPVLLVMSLVTRPTVFDLLPEISFVRSLLSRGHDVFLIDWGVPDAVESANTLETYCDDYLSPAIKAIIRTSGSDGIALVGYCFGGVISMLTTAAFPELPIRALVLLATPMDFSELSPGMKMLYDETIDPESLLDETGNIPASKLVDAFRMANPTIDFTTYSSLWSSFSNDRALKAHQALVGWSSEQIPFPGGVLRQIHSHFLRQNALVNGRVPFDGRVLDLSRIQVPVLEVTGLRDTLVPTAASRPLAATLSGAQLTQSQFPVGHAGLLVGRIAATESVPTIASWLDRHCVDEN